MKFTYDMDASSLIQRIQERTELMGPSINRRACVKNPNVVLYSVDHDKIRLLKITRFKFSFPQRVFHGRICADGEKTIISGRFVFEAVDLLFLLLIPFCIIPISVYNRHPHILKWEDIGISLLFFIIAYTLSLITSILWFHKEEKTVREFLESL